MIFPHIPWLLRLQGLIWKECLQILRDPSSIYIAFVLPLSLLFTFGYGVSLDVSQSKIDVVMKRTSPEAVDFIRSLQGSRYFLVNVYQDERDLNQNLLAGRVRGTVILPVDFSERVATKGDTAPIQVVTDGSDPNTANFVENYIQGAWSNWLLQRQQANTSSDASYPEVNLIPKVWFNQEQDSRNSLLPGALPIIVTLVGTLLTTLVVAREWDRGTMEALFSTPVTIPEILISKFIPYFFLGLMTMYICTFIMLAWFQIPFRGSFFTLTLAGSLYLVNALGMGLFISSTTKNQFVASQAALFSAFLPAFLLSGYLYEIGSMPWLIQKLTVLLPVRYCVSSIRTIFLAGDVWSVLIPAFVGMLVLAPLFYLLIGMTSKKQLE